MGVILKHLPDDMVHVTGSGEKSFLTHWHTTFYNTWRTYKY